MASTFSANIMNLVAPLAQATDGAYSARWQQHSCSQDFALEVEPSKATDWQPPGASGGEAAETEPPRKKRKMVCGGEVKSGLTEGPEETPLDLLHAWCESTHQHHSVAAAVIAQVFTNMQLWDLQYRCGAVLAGRM